MFRLLIIVATLVAACKIAFGADVAPAGPTPVIIPWGDLTVAFLNSVILPALGIIVTALAGYLAVKIKQWSPKIGDKLTSDRIERALTNALDTGVNTIDGAIKGKTLSVEVAQPVLRAAVSYAANNIKPSVIEEAGGLLGFTEKAFRKMDAGEGVTAANTLEPVKADLITKQAV